MTCRRTRFLLVLCLPLLLNGLAAGAAHASPWAEVGDSQLRSDIEVLAAAGAIDDITTHWPLPWAGIMARLNAPGALDGQPDYVRDAAERVLEKAQEQTEPDTLRLTASASATNDPSVVYGFDGLDREKAQAQVSGEYLTDISAIRINAGAIVDHKNGHTEFMPDGSYAATTVGNALVYTGYITHWWGPGWISALSESNNARPMPQIGIERLDTHAYKSPWLSWIGPWQMEFFVGWLDDSRVATNTIYDGFKFTFNPLPGLEIGLVRTDEMCGKGHPCKPIAAYFNIRNDRLHPSTGNDEGNIDIRYTGTIAGQMFAVYAQFMNEDTNPFVHSASSHLFGATTWLPVGTTRVRLTAEYADSIATADIFSFGHDFYGTAYNDAKYADGMHYRGRTLGFSLDSDSRLATLQASWVGPGDIVYALTYDHAWVNSPLAPAGSNIISATPVVINLGEAKISFPFHGMDFDIAGRLQDEQPRPEHGFKASIEGGLRVPI
jgi:hypothetical protein